MQAVVYIGHGSRVQDSNQQAKAFLKQVIKRVPVPIQEIGFLELAKPSIEDAIDRCVKRGATRIAVLPILLLTAAHAKIDIPEELEKVKKKYPQIYFDYGRPLGIHERMIDILVERLQEKGYREDETSGILLVGRGSSDQQQIEDFNEIATRFESRTGIQEVNTCFLAAATPSFEEGLMHAQHSGKEKVFIIPYLLFTGILMKKMEQQIRNLSASNQQFILCNYLGYHPNLVDVLNERVNELLVNEQILTSKFA